jgi:hypothetical protein
MVVRLVVNEYQECITKTVDFLASGLERAGGLRLAKPVARGGVEDWLPGVMA